MNQLTHYLGIIKIVAILAVIAAIFGAGHHMGAESVQADWGAANLKREKAEKSAIIQRLAENKDIEATQAETNRLITRSKDAELSKTRAAIDSAPRLRIRSICNGPAAGTETASASSGNAANPGGRILSPEMDGAIKSLIAETEGVAATGRACQTFAISNGLAP